MYSKLVELPVIGGEALDKCLGNRTGVGSNLLSDFQNILSVLKPFMLSFDGRLIIINFWFFFSMANFNTLVFNSLKQKPEAEAR